MSATDALRDLMLAIASMRGRIRNHTGDVFRYEEYERLKRAFDAAVIVLNRPEPTQESHHGK